MKKPFTLLLASLMLVGMTIGIHAQQAPEGRKWIAQNPKLVEFSSAGIHILPQNPKSGATNITTALRLPVGKPWKVSFETQVVPAANAGMSVHLTKGTTDVCWLGAGDFYKHLSGFLGSGASNMPLDQTWDAEWHRFEYINDGKMLSLWHNGSKCGETASTETPNTLRIESTGIDLRVRNVHVAQTTLPTQVLSSAHTMTSPIHDEVPHVEPVHPEELAPTSDALDANTDFAFHQKLIWITLADDIMKIGPDFYASLIIRNNSNLPIHILSPDLVFDDFSTESFYPEKGYATDLIFVDISPKSSRIAQFKTSTLSTNINPTRKPLRIKILSKGTPAITVPLR